MSMAGHEAPNAEGLRERNVAQSDTTQTKTAELESQQDGSGGKQQKTFGRTPNGTGQLLSAWDQLRRY
jgi:hypothetical protein